jgi:hypothetical protein
MPYDGIRPVIRRIIKSIRLRRRIYKGILLTALVRRNRYGITKWGVSLNIGILFGALVNGRLLLFASAFTFA